MVSLGYLQGKSTTKQNCSTYKMCKYGHLGCCYIESTLYKCWYESTLTILFVLTVASDVAVLYGNYAFSMLVRSTKRC